MKLFFLRIFTWWNGQTVGTWLYTWRKGKRVGEDEVGNIYYQTADGARRWVIYKNETDPTTVPASWHGWLHKTVDETPDQSDYQPHSWQRPHRSNKTGSAEAYRPRGSILASGSRPRATGDYEAWKPE
ncbi:MAG: NADH:ubiquinone oxidoreductase subunit NDUFA12 [Rhizobiales bacterium]|nr:NADH:ubiquinone oxidoreductase subunit NDUFA12 [Hyphomicrobiales bacterium]